MSVDFSTGHSKQLNYMMLEYARPIECLRGISKQEAKNKKKKKKPTEEDLCLCLGEDQDSCQ
jgi:hypothetical protein